MGRAGDALAHLVVVLVDDADVDGVTADGAFDALGVGAARGPGFAPLAGVARGAAGTGGALGGGALDRVSVGELGKEEEEKGDEHRRRVSDRRIAAAWA